MVRRMRIDENEAESKNGKTKIAVGKDTKRAALDSRTNGAVVQIDSSNGANKGKLRRRTVRNDIRKNKNGKKEKSVTFEPLINLKSIKPRVDTHWKNSPKRIVTRSDSKKSTNGAVIQVDSSNEANKGKVRRTVKNNKKKIENGKKERLVTFNIQNSAKKNVTRQDSKSTYGAVIQVDNSTGPNRRKIRRTVKNDKIVNDAPQIIEEQKVATIRPEEERKKEEKIETKAVKKVVVNKPDPTTSSVVPLFLEVENIDLDDSANIYLLPEYVNDIYDYLYQLEAAFPIRENHLEDQVHVTPKMRSGLINGINKVHFKLHFATDTYHMAVGIIDRYLQDVKTTPRKYLQLVGATALFIAAKVVEIYPPQIKDFIYMTNGEYSNFRMYSMEREIVKTIDFQFGRPLSIEFLRRFFKAAKSIPLCYFMSKYFIELVTLEYSLCHYKPSEVAAASLLLALFLINNEKVELSSLWTPTLKYYTKYSSEHLIPLVKKIACLVRDAPLPISRVFYTTSAVFTKFQASKFGKVALRPELSGSRIRQLCAT